MAMPLGFYLSKKNEFLEGLEEQYGSCLEKLTKNEKLLLMERLIFYRLASQGEESWLSEEETERAVDIAYDLHENTTMEELEELLLALVALLNEPQAESKTADLERLLAIFNACEEVI